LMSGLSAFFCQAEDGIRYFHVTGVQTCALPILILFGKTGCNDSDNALVPIGFKYHRRHPAFKYFVGINNGQGFFRYTEVEVLPRSEERRVGKECRSAWSPRP